eukprot:SAG31_NODE_1229_length_9222_cov_5.317549_3_plen_76_part_00
MAAAGGRGRVSQCTAAVVRAPCAMEAERASQDPGWARDLRPVRYQVGLFVTWIRYLDATELSIAQCSTLFRIFFL